MLKIYNDTTTQIAIPTFFEEGFLSGRIEIAVVVGFFMYDCRGRQYTIAQLRTFGYSIAIPLKLSSESLSIMRQNDKGECIDAFLT